MILDEFFYRLIDFFKKNKKTKSQSDEVDYSIKDLDIKISSIPHSVFLVIKKYGWLVFFHKSANFVRLTSTKYFKKSKNLYFSAVSSFKRDGLKKMLLRSSNYVFYGKGVLSRRELLQRKKLREEKWSVSAGDILGQMDYFPQDGKERILLVSHDATKTGAPILVLHIAKTLKTEFGKEVVILLIQGGPLEEEFKKYGVVVNLFHQSFSSMTTKERIVAEGVFEKLAGLGVKTCISNTVLSGMLLPFAKKYGLSCVSLVHEQSTTIKDNNFVEATEKLLQYSDKLVFSADFVKEDFARNFKKFEREILVRPQGVFLKNTFEDEKAVARKILRRRLELAPDAKIILGAGFGNLRKGVDLFFEVVRQVTEKSRELGVYFVWMGEWDCSLRDKLIKKAEKNGFLDRIILVGFENDPSVFFAGADVFLLPSRQDPFPSVVLNAMDCGLPSVAFAGGGGAPEILINQQGGVVPFEDVASMKEAVLKLLTDNDFYGTASEEAKKAIEKKFIFKDYVKFLLDRLEEVKKKSSVQKKRKESLRVSVIVPNYNYEKFLPERLNSIISQTYQPFEIIFLDDNSQDKSLELAEKILAKTEIPHKIIPNKVNKGCFSQWSKGVKEAGGDLVWIAEADDSCRLNFLEMLVVKFEDPKVGLAYAQSVRMNEQGKKEETYLFCLEADPGHDNHWRQDYVGSGAEEVCNYLVTRNTLFNASALLMRRDLLVDLGEDIGGGFKQAGDWFTYIKILENSKIAFCSQPLNYHRHHSQNIVSRSGTITEEKAKQLVSESLDIQNLIVSQFAVSKERASQALEHTKLVCRNNLKQEIEVFPEFSKRVQQLAGVANSSQKRVLFFSTNDGWGGSEVSCAKLAEAFSSEDFLVALCMKKHSLRPEILKKIDFEKKVFLFEREDAGDYCRAEKTRNFVNNFKPDLVFISQGHMFEGTEMMAWCRSRGLDYVNFIPLVTKEHLEIIKPTKEALLEGGKMLRKSRMIFSDNRSAQKLLEEIFKTKFNNFSVIRNAFDVPYDQTPTWEKSADGFLKLIFIGRLYFLHKGLDMLLEVLAMKKWKERPLKIMAFGEGEDRGKMEEYIKKNDIKNFIFCGYTQELKTEIIKCQGIIFPSRMEGTPIALVDALLCHRMAIVTPVGGMTEFVEEGKTGFVASASTKEALDGCLEKAWEKRDEWQKIGENAGERVRKLVPEFPQKQWADEIKKLLR